MTSSKMRQVSILDILPSPENDFYKDFNVDNADDKALLEDIRANGVLEPLIISNDGFIISGHRRYVAARALGLDAVPVLKKDISRKDHTPDQWITLLAEHNNQREKTLDEILREQVIASNPDNAYHDLVQYRLQKSEIKIKADEINGVMQRARISKAKDPFLNAILNILESLKKYLPISVRALHYRLLNDPPLIHASKPDSVYKNDLKSYQALDNLVTRARLEGRISMHCIKDETRPVQCWNVYDNVGGFIKKETDKVLRGYWRDLMQSQPNHVEIIVEKKTLVDLVEKVAADYCIPVTAGGGYCSLPPRYDMANRYFNSGKLKLVLILLSDHDPDGLEISHSFARSMRDDFGIRDVEFIRAAITQEQIEELNLAPNMLAKQSSRNYDKFVEEYGTDVFELEAIPPEELTRILRETIDGVIDHGSFEHEQKKEREEAAFLDTARQRAVLALKGLEVT